MRISIEDLIKKIDHIEACTTEIERFLDANGIALDKKDGIKGD